MLQPSLFHPDNSVSTGDGSKWRERERESSSEETNNSERTLESPLDFKIKPVNPKWNQPWIFIGRTDAKLKLQYFGHLMQRVNSLEKTLMLGKIESRRRRRWKRMRWLDSITNSVDMSLGKPWEIVRERSLAYCSPWGCKELDAT